MNMNASHIQLIHSHSVNMFFEYWTFIFNTWMFDIQGDIQHPVSTCKKRGKIFWNFFWKLLEMIWNTWKIEHLKKEMFAPWFVVLVLALVKILQNWISLWICWGYSIHWFWIWNNSHIQAFEYECPTFNIHLIVQMNWMYSIRECSSVCRQYIKNQTKIK